MSSIIKNHNKSLSVITPLYYYFNDDNRKVYDIEEIQNSFNEIIQKLKDHNYNGVNL